MEDARSVKVTAGRRKRVRESSSPSQSISAATSPKTQGESARLGAASSAAAVTITMEGGNSERDMHEPMLARAWWWKACCSSLCECEECCSVDER